MPQAPEGKLILFKSADGSTRVECRVASETLWLSQSEICSLYGKAKATVSGHISKIFQEGECDEDSVVRLYRTTAADGKPYKVKYYSLPLILAVGYRVRSPQGVQFRQWATQTLQEYLIKGFAMDDEPLKHPDSSVYFEQLLARIRDIRSSEKVFWRKVCDIYATSIDYDGKAETSQQFFAQVQNKMHWATHGHTAAELNHAGAISAAQAKQKAAMEYDAYQRVIDAKPSQVDQDLEQAIKRLSKGYRTYALTAL